MKLDQHRCNQSNMGVGDTSSPKKVIECQSGFAQHRWKKIDNLISPIEKGNKSNFRFQNKKNHYCKPVSLTAILK